MILGALAMIENNDKFENWILPDISTEEADKLEGTSLFGKPASWYSSDNEEDIEDSTEEAPVPLTLDDIEAIRQSAYDDGFKEGKEAGFEQGLTEGKERGLKEGAEEGLELGLKEGLCAGKAQIDEQVSIWSGLIERLYNPLEKLDDNVEYQLVHLATNLAEQITLCDVKSSPQIILQALKKSIEALPVNEQKLKILLHPDDLKFVLDVYSEEECTKRGWDVQADAALSRGDCQIYTQTSTVDYVFSTRIKQVLKKFFQENHQQLPTHSENLLNDQPLTTIENEPEEPELEAVDNLEQEPLNE